jgi:hypothetical protein
LRSGYNLPPGVFESDLPGNSSEDHCFQDQIERLWEIMDSYGLEPGFLDGFMANDNFVQKRDASYERKIVSELSLWPSDEIDELLSDLEDWVDGHGILRAALTARNSKLKFNQRACQWIRETQHLSNVEQIVIHPAYQQIIGMGPVVVPYILEAMRIRPNHWFWALSAITGENPVLEEDAGDIRKMTEAWLRLGRERGWI